MEYHGQPLTLRQKQKMSLNEVVAKDPVYFSERAQAERVAEEVISLAEQTAPGGNVALIVEVIKVIKG